MGWACSYCGGSAHHGQHVAREAMFGLDGRFSYLECSACGSWTIADVPADLGRYYPASYLSLGSVDDGGVKRLLKRLRFEASRGAGNPLGRLLVRRYGAPNIATWLSPVHVSHDSAILDVGCGNGHVLAQLRDVGFTRLTGVDPFMPEDAQRPGLRLLRGEIESVQDRFDLIMFHHSLEHTVVPQQQLSTAAGLLQDDGTILVRIPLVGSEAQRRFGVNWSQLDAPRHLALPTQQGLRALAARCGLQIVHVHFDSDAFQFWASELLAEGGTLMNDSAFNPSATSSRFTADDLRRYAAQAAEANKAGVGDQACFYLRRSPKQD